MHIIQAIILGIVEGITEFLPVSSTGHLILASTLLHITQTEFVKSFEIIIQVGAILAAVVLYFRRIITSWEIIKRLVVAFIPTGIVGLALYSLIKKYLIGNNTVALWALLLGGIVLIVFEWLHKPASDTTAELEKITYKQSFIIGCFQAIAIIPGVSRSAATIIGGMLMGVKRRTIVEFSFMLAIPTMLAASGLDLLKSYKNLGGGHTGILAVGFISSFVVAIFSIRTFIRYIQKHDFKPFGIYRILLAIIFWIFV